MTRTVKRPNWRLPLYGVLAAMLILCPKIIFGNDIGTFLISGIVAAIVTLILLVILFLAIRRQGPSALWMLVTFCAILWLLFRTSDDIRTTGRWLIKSKSYKTTLSAQQISPSTGLRHLEWDGWGFIGSGNTVEYLVFDPNDSLAIAAKSRSSGKFRGLPCEVLRVRRLETQWYTVRFYTDTDWDHCS